MEYAKAKEINMRFEKLYNLINKRLSVPFEFVNGTEIKWEEIYYNFDYLIQELEGKIRTLH